MIGRKIEVKTLISRYESGRAELVAVYGRRRVGKTYLIDETFENRITFHHAGLSPVDQQKNGLLKRQLDRFYFSLISQGMPEGKRPKSWMEAFYMLEVFLRERDNGSRQLVFLDELPWMDTPRSGFLSAFEGFWNNWGCRHKNLMVVVCGSATSWILDNLINNHGGLYNRVTCEIKLLPFTLKECEEFFEDRSVSLSRYDIVQSYMALGGIPYYLSYFDRSFSLAQNLDNLFFKRNAVLKDEYERLFDSIFDRPAMMKTIVKKLCSRSRGFTRSELLNELHLKDGELFSKCIKALIASEFVIKYVPFGYRENEFHYKLIDPFCIFWLYFVENRSASEEDYWLQNLYSQAVVSWRGLAFENVCWCHIPQLKKALGISQVSTTCSAWNKKPDDEEGLQIDLLIFRKDNIVNMCEMKYYGDTFKTDSDYYRTILRRAEILSGRLDRKTSVHPTLITTYGLENNKYSGIFTDVITMNDLF